MCVLAVFRHSQLLQVECRINLRSMTTKDHLHKILTDMLVQLSNKHETFLEMKYSLSHPYILDLRCVWLVFMINVGSKKNCSILWLLWLLWVFFNNHLRKSETRGTPPVLFSINKSPAHSQWPDINFAGWLEKSANPSDAERFKLSMRIFCSCLSITWG